jgi:diacylglycerol kinase (ATP)
MTNTKSTSIGSRIKSVAYALNGLKHLIKTEPNATIHLVATFAAIITGLVSGLTRMEWIAIAVAIGLVWIAEGFNTCIELLCDATIGTKYDKRVEVIKDISAASVLLASFVSIVIGIIVFFF